MSDMMKMFVEQELQNQIKENYPHMQYPPGLYAKVVSVHGLQRQSLKQTATGQPTTSQN